MSVKTTIATEISNQINEKVINDLIIDTFINEKSKFALSVKSISYMQTRKLFTNEFFVSVFTNMIKSGAMNEQIKDIVLRKINDIFDNNKSNLMSIIKTRENYMKANIDLSTEEYNESEFWNEIRAIVKPLMKEPIQEDINKINCFIDLDDKQIDIDVKINPIDIINTLKELQINDSIKEIFIEVSFPMSSISP